MLDRGDVDDLLAFLAACPSPYHAAAEAARRLEAVGFARLDEADAWPEPGRHLVVRDGSVVAWDARGSDRWSHGIRLVGAHTDSPNLRLKPRPDTGRGGWRQLAVEVYGSALWSTWMDRDLGLSGRVALRSPTGPVSRLVRDDRPLARIPHLAIHLDRTVNSDGLRLDAQTHLVPIWGLGDPEEGALRSHLARLAGVAPYDVLGWDVMLHDVHPPTRAGVHAELISSARIDNLLSCWAALCALSRVAGDDGSPPDGPVPMICLFDHEEIGSQSSAGADSVLLPTILGRLAERAGLGADAWAATLARSLCVSADGAHATSPNHVERHEPTHHVRPGAGPVLKRNANVRYATDALTGAAVSLAAEEAGVGLQEFVVRSGTPCGSTIGPVTAARLGIPTVDVGVPQLAMHSARELCTVADAEDFVPLLEAVLAPTH